jgi:hypothetical protein
VQKIFKKNLKISSKIYGNNIEVDPRNQGENQGDRFLNEFCEFCSDNLSP